MSTVDRDNPAQMLNRMTPGAAYVRLGDMLQEMIETHNAIRDGLSSLLEKLDGDEGITDTDYAASIDLPAELKELKDRL